MTKTSNQGGGVMLMQLGFQILQLTQKFLTVWHWLIKLLPGTGPGHGSLVLRKLCLVLKHDYQQSCFLLRVHRTKSKSN